MNRDRLAKDLAIALTNGAWTQDQVNSRLSAKLPPALNHLSASLSLHLITALPSIYSPSARAVEETLFQTDEFDSICEYCQQRGVWPVLDLTEPKMAPIPAFAGLTVPQIATLDALADWLRLPGHQIDYYADTAGRHENHRDAQVNHYHYALHPQKSGGLRVIEAPKQILKSIQRQILRGILDLVPTHPDAFGFVPHRNCIQSAARHAAEEIVVTFDLKDFFPSIGTGRVFGLFRCLGYPHAVAARLTGLCTTQTPHRILQRLDPSARAIYRERHLPQGAPTSPALTNHVAFTLDKRLFGLARSLSANYSRYADDLSFSGDYRVYPTLMRVVPDIIRDEGLSLNPRKTHIMSATSRQLVTGIVVNRHVNVPRQHFDQLKAVIHACKAPEDQRLSDPTFRAKLLGEIAWVEAVNPQRGLKLRQKLAEVI